MHDNHLLLYLCLSLWLYLYLYLYLHSNLLVDRGVYYGSKKVGLPGSPANGKGDHHENQHLENLQRALRVKEGQLQLSDYVEGSFERLEIGSEKMRH